MSRNTVLAIVAIVIIAITGVVLSQFASSEPDGLEYVAQQQGFEDDATDHAMGDAPLADYGANLSNDSVLATAAAGAIGLTVTLALAVGIFWIVRDRRDDASTGS
jgi:cobalt/nickel transport protein